MATHVPPLVNGGTEMTTMQQPLLTTNAGGAGTVAVAAAIQSNELSDHSGGGFSLKSAKKLPWIAYTPVFMFTMSLGISASASNWRKVSAMLSDDAGVRGFSHFLFAFACLHFGVVSILYLWKTVFYYKQFLEDWNHPVRVGVFPTWGMAACSIGNAAYLDYPPFSYGMFWLGVINVSFFTLLIVGRWVRSGKPWRQSFSAAMLVPAGACATVSILAPRVEMTELGFFFFSVAVVLWPVTLAVVYSIFINGGKSHLQPVFFPTLFVMIAPPALLTSSWVALGQPLGVAGRVFYYSALVFFFLNLRLIKFVVRAYKGGFNATWFSWVFPMTSLSTAGFDFNRDGSTPGNNTVGFVSPGLTYAGLAISSLILLLVYGHFVVALVRNKVFVPLPSSSTPLPPPTPAP